MAITLRDIPEDVSRRIEEHARRTGLSRNRTVIELLREQAKPSGPTIHHDLDALCGIWSREEADRFDLVLSDQRTIDPDEWR